MRGRLQIALDAAVARSVLLGRADCGDDAPGGPA